MNNAEQRRAYDAPKTEVVDVTFENTILTGSDWNTNDPD